MAPLLLIIILVFFFLVLAVNSPPFDTIFFVLIVRVPHWDGGVTPMVGVGNGPQATPLIVRWQCH